MDVLVIYESVMGNTRLVAEAIADGVRRAAPELPVHCAPVGRAPAELPAEGLVVVGSPTHWFGLPAAGSRRRWVQGMLKRSRAGVPSQHLEPGAAGTGLREWFAELAPASPHLVAAAFDTRLSRPLSGGAARPIAKALRRLGLPLVAPPQGFLVEGMAGPLRVGEIARALAWGEQLGRAVRPGGLAAPPAVEVPAGWPSPDGLLG